MTTIRSTLILLGTFAVTACSSTTMIPQAGGLFTVIANASSEDQATELASYKARSTCQLQNQSLQVIDLKTSYQGIDHDQQKLIELAQKTLPPNKISGSYSRSNYNYKSTITFRCI